MLKYTNFKYCPKCGKNNLEILGQSGVFCPDCDFTYYHNTASAVGAIILTPKGIMLLKRAHEPKSGLYDVPGGFVDYKENLEDALKRELREELDIEVTDIRYFSSFSNTYIYKNITYFTTDAFFLCNYSDPKEPVLNEENSEIIYVNPDNFPIEQMAFDSGKAALKLYKSLHG